MKQEKKLEATVETYLKEVGTRINEVVDGFKYRKDAAKAGGISTDQLNRYTEGSSPRIGFIPVGKICQAAGFNMEWVLTGKGAKKTDTASGGNATYQAGSKEYNELMDDIKLVVTELENFLKDNQLQIEDPDTKAKLTAMVVDYVHTRDKSRADEPVSAQIVRLMKYAS